jgi:biopolymer transport protein ExbB
MVELFDKTGMLGWPLLAMSIALVTILILRAYYYLTYKNMTSSMVQSVYALLKDKQYDQALSLLNQAKHTNAARLCYLLINNRAHKKEVRDELVSHVLVECKQSLFSGIRMLRIIALLSPMVGLLGTVIGMIGAFQVIATNTGPVNPALIADGLWVAMLTTAIGLIIALPALIAAHWFTRTAEKYIGQYENTLNLFSFALEGVDLELPEAKTT